MDREQADRVADAVMAQEFERQRAYGERIAAAASARRTTSTATVPLLFGLAVGAAAGATIGWAFGVVGGPSPAGIGALVGLAAGAAWWRLRRGR